MKKTMLSIVMMLFCVWGYTQELPTIIPPSPTAFELTKYGNINVNESMGEITTSIPLYSYKSGSLNLPIFVSYAGGGVKVDQLSSWTGINWNLRAGGVITRTVRDRPDEIGSRVFFTDEEFNNLPQTVEGINNLDKLHNLRSKDSEVDIFNFNFLGFSGSFYLDENYIPKLSNYNQELNIKFVGGFSDNDNQQIILTDASGIQYIFGGINATERTRTNPGGVDFSTLDNPITSFYLVKIKNATEDEIYFDYLEDDVYTTYLGINEFASKIIALDGGEHAGSNTGKSTIKNIVYNGKYLSKIRSNRDEQEIVFNSTFVGNNHFHRVLNSIEINKKKYELFKKIDFSYSHKKDLINSTRFFLNKVEFFNKNNTFKNKYVFEYNGIQLPDRLSTAKDHLGYYNGANNSSLLPFEIIDNYGKIKALADREPSFSHAVKGTLTKISYPTKGYTTFEYEAPKVNNYIKKGISLKVYKDLAQLNSETFPVPDTKLIDTFFLDPDFNTENSVVLNQELKIDVNTITNSTQLNSHYKVKIEVINTTDSFNHNSNIQYLTFDRGTFVKQESFNFSLKKDNSYIIKAELITPTGVTNNYPIKVDIYFELIAGIELVDNVGVRIKRVTDYSVNTNTANSKVYHYSKISDIGNVDKIPFKKQYSAGYMSTAFYTLTELVPDGSGFETVVPRIYRKFDINSESINAIFPNGSSNYQTVSVSFNDDFEGGGIQKTFRSIKPQNPFKPFSFYPANQHISNQKFSGLSKENRNVYNGELLEELFFEKKGNELNLIQKNKKNYQIDYNNYITNTVSKKDYSYDVLFYDSNSIDDTERTTSIHHLSFGRYRTYTNKSNLNSQEQTQYLEPVPISDLGNEANYKQIKTITNYSYKENLVGLPIEVKTTNSRGEFTKIKNYYPSDKNSITDLTDDNKLNLDIMKAQHRVGETIQVERYINNSLQSKERTIYKSFYTGVVLPEKVQASKETQVLEDRIIYHSYDDKGNPTEVSKADGTHIVYIWGYNQTQPIAKIENAKLSDIPNTYIDPIRNASNLDNDRTIDSRDNNGSVTNYIGNEGQLRFYLNKLHQLTALENSQMTFYTYDPLIGVTSITDPRGQTVYYQYDEFNRLEFIKDADGNLLKEHKYNYKN